MFDWQLLRQQAVEVRQAWPSVLLLCFATAMATWWVTTSVNDAHTRTQQAQIELLRDQKEAAEEKLQDLQPVTPRYDLELNCQNELMPPVVGYENRVEVISIFPNNQRLLVGEMWGLNDQDKKLPWRLRCTLTNRSNMPLAGMYIDFNYVAKPWAEGKGGVDKILGSYKQNFWLGGSMQPGDSRQFWMWVEPRDVYINADFGQLVMAGTHDGRAVNIPLRQTGQRMITLTPPIA
jgi:hypothetical protein